LGRSPVSSRLSAAAGCLSRHLRMKSATHYSFGEIDETGKAHPAAFAADHGGLQFEFMPIEVRLYFMKAAG
jgi:hypothetical protein